MYSDFDCCFGIVTFCAWCNTVKITCFVERKVQEKKIWGRGGAWGAGIREQQRKEQTHLDLKEIDNTLAEGTRQFPVFETFWPNCISVFFFACLECMCQGSTFAFWWIAFFSCYYRFRAKHLSVIYILTIFVENLLEKMLAGNNLVLYDLFKKKKKKKIVLKWQELLTEELALELKSVSGSVISSVKSEECGSTKKVHSSPKTNSRGKAQATKKMICCSQLLRKSEKLFLAATTHTVHAASWNPNVFIMGWENLQPNNCWTCGGCSKSRRFHNLWWNEKEKYACYCNHMEEIDWLFAPNCFGGDI